MAGLAELHRRHLDAVPYDSLAIMLGRPDPTDPAQTLERIAAGGNAGYCFHHNGAFEVVLRALGFAVERRFRGAGPTATSADGATFRLAARAG